ncbi:uncharacterized protein LOC109363817 [Meleagris gallopavo]|uniref:uncharacterized protein LOC109363817 n=1 Tax=Meleagris gallopavo TaxID=9103 RepID=UPI00093B652D|nr:uncharacterized protein LOC109363817 [Meleagris gallopavo]
MLARRRASQVMMSQKRRKELEKKKQRVKFRFLPQLEQEYAEVLKKAARQPKPTASAQQTSRMEARLKHAQTEARRLQVLMASKRKEVEAEIWSEYEQCTQRQSTERSQNPFHRLLEGDPRPAYIVRRDYDRQLGERLKGKDRCHSPAGQTAPEGWQNKPQLPGTSREQKGEKTRLLDRRGKAQGLPTPLGSCQAASSSSGRSHHGLHQNAASGASNCTRAHSGRTSHRCTLPSL